MVVMHFVVVIFATISCLYAADLPSYIKPCSLSDVDLNKCALKNGQEALPYIIKGDKKYKIPILAPLEIREIKFNTGSFNIRLNNANIFGLENTKIKDIKIDLKRQHFDITVGIDWANIISQYNLDGKVLVVPIAGNGDANITFVGGIYRYSFDFGFKEVGGKKYLNVTNHNLDYTIKKAHFHFDNLFNGDKGLGEQTNKFLNENYKEVGRELGPTLTETISSIITTVVTGIFEVVPYSVIFTP